MLPSEIDPLPGRVGLLVGETVLSLYVGSVDRFGDAGAVGLVAVEDVGDAGAVDSVAVERLVTGEPGSVGPPEGDSSVRDETAELPAPEEQAVVSEAHRIAITAATQRRRHMRARRIIGGTGGVRTGLVLSPGCAGTLSIAVVPIVSLLPLSRRKRRRARHDGMKTLTPVSRQGNWAARDRTQGASFVSPQSFTRFLLLNRIEATTACASHAYSCLYAPAIWTSYLSEGSSAHFDTSS
jgi:hypothetical protein